MLNRTAVHFKMLNLKRPNKNSISLAVLGTGLLACNIY